MALKTLVIVESRAKGEKIQAYLGSDFVVKACYGHVRDLPRNRDEIPPELAEARWANLGIDIENDFRLLYVVPKYQEGKDRVDTARVVADIRATAKQLGSVILATDPDREGEAIALHLAELCGLGDHARRITFNEITKEAVLKAVAAPRTIDRALVEAQEARRALDRLCGFEISPVLARNVAAGVSAGRVQSAALAALARQEHARLGHVSAGYVRFTVKVAAEGGAAFTAPLLSVNGVGLGTPKDYGADGQLKPGVAGLTLAAAQQGDVPEGALLVLSEADGQLLGASLKGQQVQVTSVESTEYAIKPPPPFTTATMQQEASKQLKFSLKVTMDTAQRLYEAGKITYMRTDSPSLSSEATQAARAAAVSLFGEGAVPVQARAYAAKGQNAQEAHEAVRPSGSVFVPPADSALQGEDLALYDLIYRRTLASQMTDLRGLRTTVYLGAEGLLFGTVGRAITERGFTRLFEDAREEEGEAPDAQTLPPLAEGQALPVLSTETEAKRTPAPKRYTDATLVKALERAEIGRPSTYQATVQTLHDRQFVQQVGGAARQLAVTWIGLLCDRYLNDNFPLFMDPRFTAQMEGYLDQIAGGKLSYAAYLDHFWNKQMVPLVREASMQPPTLTLPRVPGAVVGMKGETPTLKMNGQYMPIPAHVMPDDLTPELAVQIMRGEEIKVKKTRKASAKVPTELKAPPKAGKRSAP